jgi:CPA1 family monovalent cation:H+ antiporter
VIRKVNIEDRYSPIPLDRQEIIIQKKIAQYSLQHLEENYGNDWNGNEHLANLQSRLKIDSRLLGEELENEQHVNIESLREFYTIYLALLEHQRKVLEQMNHRSEFDEELIRKYQALIDMEEHKIREKTLA